jgi:hypothetical protein
MAQCSVKQRDNVVLTLQDTKFVSSASSITSSSASLSFTTVMHVPLMAGPYNIYSCFTEQVSVAVHILIYIPMVPGSELSKDVGYITDVCCRFLRPFSKTAVAPQLRYSFFLARRLQFVSDPNH